MPKFSSTCKSAMVNCEIYRYNNKIGTFKGLIYDTQNDNYISFDLGTDVKIFDDVYCPIKDKHYIITNVDKVLIQGKPFRIDAYFENNFNTNKNNTTIFNTYNPNNSVIGTQQYVTLNINDCFNNLTKQIEENGFEDKEQLYELLDCIKSNINNNQISKSTFSKFKYLFEKHGPWLIPLIVQTLMAWLQL